MTEEKKAGIRKKILIAQLGIAAILIGYLVYGLVTKNTNPLVFNILAVVLVGAFVILNDLVEPYLTEVFEGMDEFRKNAYRNYVLWDVASMAGLLFFVTQFTETSNMMIYLGLVVYFIGSKKKRTYQSAAMGKLTKEDVEAAKAAAEEPEKSLETEEN